MEHGTAQRDTVLITGANRGIGLAFAAHYLDQGCRVFAACRRPAAAAELHELRRRFGETQCGVLELDLAREDLIAAAARHVSEAANAIDVLINNAGCLASGESGLHAIKPETMMNVFRVNSLGPLLMTRAFLPLLRRAERPRVLCLTSRTAVLRAGERAGGGQFSYAMSKAALHMAIPKLAAEVAEAGVIVVGVDPGFVRTDMTGGYRGPRRQMRPEEAVRGMASVADRLQRADSGALLRWDGATCRWYAPAETPEELQIV